VKCVKNLIYLALLILLAAGAWFGLTEMEHRARATAAIPDDSSLAKVERRTLDYYVKSSGEIAPAVQVDVKPEISARIKKLHIIAGQSVKEGTLLVELDDRDLLTEKDSQLTQIHGMEVELDKARRQHERSLALFTRGLIPKQDFEDAKTSLDLAQNNLDKAQGLLRSVQDRLAKTQVFAPISGTVLVVPVVTGQVVVGAASVNSGTLLMTIADLTQMIINTQVNQVDISQIKPAQEVEFTVDSVRNRVMKGTVSLISPVASVKNNNKGFLVTVLIRELDPAVRPGMSANVNFPINRVENTLCVPLTTVFTAPDGTRSVYVFRGAAEPEKRHVELGIVTFDYAEITSGLKEGDKVLLNKPGGN
jgi:RND family efflux transporter MFP subunit